ncbi:hypothetical protein B0T20DRAFT_389734 [Sordaria brevicollis]|uniref:Uncharacterized protein n=1 Tax=Sordaria brevicollis TaxID=83679 RepID=A0AAE0PLK0_SORBR|nr:hypothetical protein B0T20DRAFT_389734 [Sordaria brevicollis]
MPHPMMTKHTTIAHDGRNVQYAVLHERSLSAIGRVPFNLSHISNQTLKSPQIGLYGDIIPSARGAVLTPHAHPIPLLEVDSQTVTLTVTSSLSTVAGVESRELTGVRVEFVVDWREVGCGGLANSPSTLRNMTNLWDEPGQFGPSNEESGLGGRLAAGKSEGVDPTPRQLGHSSLQDTTLTEPLSDNGGCMMLRGPKLARLETVKFDTMVNFATMHLSYPCPRAGGLKPRMGRPARRS